MKLEGFGKAMMLVALIVAVIMVVPNMIESSIEAGEADAAAKGRSEGLTGLTVARRDWSWCPKGYYDYTVTGRRYGSTVTLNICASGLHTYVRDEK